MITWTETDMPDGWAGALRMADGRWFSRCRACDHHVYQAEAWPRYMTVGRHEVDVHGLQVPGINVGLLS